MESNEGSLDSVSRISTLMGQLKTGEINTAELFHNFADLEALSTNTPDAVQDTRKKPASNLNDMVFYDDNGLRPADPLSPRSTGFVSASGMEFDSAVGKKDKELPSSSISLDAGNRMSVKEWLASRQPKDQSQSPSIPITTRSIDSSSVASEEKDYFGSARDFLARDMPNGFRQTKQRLDALFDSEKSESSRSSSQWESGSDEYGEQGPEADTGEQSLSSYSGYGSDVIDYPYEQKIGKEAREESLGSDPEYNNHQPPRAYEQATSPRGGSPTRELDSKFHARVTRWKSQREETRERLREQLRQSELDECTFRPKISSKSSQMAAKRRGGRYSYQQDSDNMDGEDDRLEYSLHGQEASERLYQDVRNYRAVQELAAKIKAEEEEQIQRECTFRPKLNRRSLGMKNVRSKYMNGYSPKPSSVSQHKPLDSDTRALQACTFAPKTNAIADDMVSAQLYLSQNIYDRLSRPCAIDSGSRASSPRSVSVSGTADDIAVNGFRRSHRASATSLFDIDAGARRRLMTSDSRMSASLSPRGKRLQRPRSAGGRLDDDRQDRHDSFDEFLARQSEHEASRRRKREDAIQELYGNRKPNLNKRSLALMKSAHRGDFLERVQVDAIKREQENMRKSTIQVWNADFTFKPAINETSAKRRPRSVTEMSRGDLLRRETSQRLMKLRMEQQEMSSLTFRPQLNRVSTRHEGRLKILTSPETYLERIQQNHELSTIKTRRAQQQREMQEFAECTFKPRTIEAPAYVQRIARSVNMSKTLRQQKEAKAKAKAKPEWR